METASIDPRSPEAMKEIVKIAARMPTQGGSRTSPNPITSSMTERVLYESSNGDAWFLARDPVSKMPVVRHISRT